MFWDLHYFSIFFTLLTPHCVQMHLLSLFIIYLTGPIVWLHNINTKLVEWTITFTLNLFSVFLSRCL